MKYTPSRAALGVVACLAIVLAGVATVTPAGATLKQEAQAVAKQKWGKVWNKKLQPRADKRYYTKTSADAKYATKAESDAKYYSKADSDAKYYSKADSDAKYYSRTEADAKFQQKQKFYRGTYMMSGNGAGALMSADISFGVTLAAAPTAHYIPVGGAVPAGCTGTAATPNADPGHLCVFEADAFNAAAGRRVTNLAYTLDTATPAGGYLWGYAAAAGLGYAAGSWAMQPGGAAVVTSLKAPSFGPIGRLPH